ncbi:MarR family winged helix-turn-helix transcriptional regulator [Actinacidiphila paucisporea]|nr:MarR family transcriptional regulator [Actinacidiphila paucisporea]
MTCTDDIFGRSSVPNPEEAPGAGGGGLIPDPDGEPDTTVDVLVRLPFLVHGVLTGVAAEYDVSLVQLRLFGILRDRRPGMLELAGYLGLDKSSMTGLVARAEKRGLVQRLPSPHDGRGVLVSPTPEGRRITRQGAAGIARRLDALTTALTPAERTRFHDLAEAPRVIVSGRCPAPAVPSDPRTP